MEYLNNFDAGFLFLTKPSQETHSYSTQRLRWFSQEQKDKSKCSSYFMRVPKVFQYHQVAAESPSYVLKSFGISMSFGAIGFSLLFSVAAFN